MDWTEEQKDAIYKRGSNILVAAAAGSGKTAVLVERIIQKILNDGIDIDKLLVVTFTNAAASEMRERVLDAIYKKLEEDPENENLQRQIVLLGKSNICTIHSFCLDVIRNNFFEIPNLSANFIIGVGEEIELLKQEVLEEVFEKLYEEDDERFAKLVATYTNYKSDDSLKELILKIYNFMQSNPFPEEWITEKTEMFKCSNTSDFSETIWGKILLDDLKEGLIDSINSLRAIEKNLQKFYELDKYRNLIESDIETIKKIYDLSDSWDDVFEFYQEDPKKIFDKWITDRKIVIEAKEEAKNARAVVLKRTKDTLKDILTYDSKSAIRDINEMYEVLDILREVILVFDENFKARKNERNILDFNDIEHFALKILISKNDGKIIPTEVAKRYQEKFEEIAIDEYQDSNKVQELILNSVSRKNNIFMVGDVKQSIYKFRQSCPALFLEKYESYGLKNANENGLKIQLFKNFRSRANVLDITNEVFKNIMSKKLGDIDYNEEEYLNLGADFEENDNTLDKAEFDIIDIKENEESIWKDEEQEDDEDENEEDAKQEETEKEQLEKYEIEARFVAKRIQELIKSKVQIHDRKLGYRDIKYKDIVILLRSTEKLAPIFERELLKNNIPIFSDSSNEYLDTIEIQTIISTLKILDNPIDDISLVSVLRSIIGGFTDNEIVEIRLCEKNGSFYNSLIVAKDTLTGEIKEKIELFFNRISKWKKQSDYLSLAELIWMIYSETGFYNYVGLMPNGSLRQANLKMLFERAKDYEKTSFKGLYNFIKFVERLKLGDKDMSSAKVISENENVVRLMSIHKSKGLEFPIVFLCATSKHFNLTDLSSDILLHDDYGLGPQYINYEKMIEYSTSAKDALKIVSKNESISEEMRILYVALTRAKEKLVITATVKDYLKDINTKKEMLDAYKNNENTINPIILKKYIDYYDWLSLVFLNSDKKDLLTINVMTKEEALKDTNTSQEEDKKEFDFNQKIDFTSIEKEFSWTYKNEFLSTLPIKSTVSKIKEKQEDVVDLEEYSNKNKEVGIAQITPKFTESEERISGARIGTLMHLMLQKINLKLNYSIDDLKQIKQELVLKGMMTEPESNLVNVNKIDAFLKSDIAKKISEAKTISQEKTFCIKLSAKELYDEATDEKILVQGIIDLYAITNENNIILLDYKTDFVQEGKENALVDKYYNQLRIYKTALESALKLNVNEVYIYSLFANKAIKVDI